MYPKYYTRRNLKVVGPHEDTFHADGGADQADLNDEDGWIDLGPDDPVEKYCIHTAKLHEARNEGMYEKIVKALEKLLTEFGDVVKLKLNDGEPADAEPLKIQFKPDAVPVRAKQRKCPQEKRVFMTRYVNELVRMGF